MDFDFSHISVPFRMQPGLRRIEPSAVRLTRLEPHGRLYAEKRAVLECGQSRHVLAGFDAAPALAAIAQLGMRSGCEFQPDRGPPLELVFEEDFAVLDGSTGILPWLCVCTPSHWAPEQKLGLGFAALHGPVADNAALVAASQQLVALVTAGECWERHVWTISPSARYDQHPHRHAREAWPATGDAGQFASRCWLRVERQIFFPVGSGTQQAVFAIRVMLEPLAQAAQQSGAARRLHDAVATMSQAVLEYKNLAAAREPLLRWLEAKS